jgi:hypothetical protein
MSSAIIPTSHAFSDTGSQIPKAEFKTQEISSLSQIKNEEGEIVELELGALVSDDNTQLEAIDLSTYNETPDPNSASSGPISSFSPCSRSNDVDAENVEGNKCIPIAATLKANMQVKRDNFTTPSRSGSGRKDELLDSLTNENKNQSKTTSVQFLSDSPCLKARRYLDIAHENVDREVSLELRNRRPSPRRVSSDQLEEFIPISNTVLSSSFSSRGSSIPFKSPTTLNFERIIRACKCKDALNGFNNFS